MDDSLKKKKKVKSRYLHSEGWDTALVTCSGA